MKFFWKKKKDPKEKMKALLFSLRELAATPPVSIDLYEWQDDLDDLMERIKERSLPVYEQLEDLVLEVRRRGGEHVRDVEADEAPNVSEESRRRYFEQVAFLNEEIQSLVLHEP